MARILTVIVILCIGIVGCAPKSTANSVLLRNTVPSGLVTAADGVWFSNALEANGIGSIGAVTDSLSTRTLLVTGGAAHAIGYTGSDIWYSVVRGDARTAESSIAHMSVRTGKINEVPLPGRPLFVDHVAVSSSGQPYFIIATTSAIGSIRSGRLVQYPVSEGTFSPTVQSTSVAVDNKGAVWAIGSAKNVIFVRLPSGRILWSKRFSDRQLRMLSFDGHAVIAVVDGANIVYRLSRTKMQIKIERFKLPRNHLTAGYVASGGGLNCVTLREQTVVDCLASAEGVKRVLSIALPEVPTLLAVSGSGKLWYASRVLSGTDTAAYTKIGWVLVSSLVRDR